MTTPAPTSPSPSPRPRLRLTPMRPRDPHEPHRAASSLELFFDLVLLVLLVAVLVWRPPVTATR